VGACEDGWPTCDDDNKVLSCDSEVIPEPEYCNGIDDDCDGRIDEGFLDENIGEACGSGLGECESGSWQCYRGEVVCYGSRAGADEICDGKDNDCNGLVDDVGIISLCYDGDTQTLLAAACHAGTLQCIGGGEVCVGQALPSTEICDEIDNDCNGLVDEGLGSLEFDVLFIIDRSCSMVPNAFNAAIGSMYGFVSLTESDDAYRFALIGLPEKLNSNIPIKISDLVDGATMLETLNRASWVSMSGYEPSYDALMQIGTGEMPFTWRENALRYIFLWTDEPGQSYYLPSNTQSMVAALLPVDSYIFHGFVPSTHWHSFTDVAAATGGSMLLLEQPEEMLLHLKDILKQRCM
jgi:hypothetical protein